MRRWAGIIGSILLGIPAYALFAPAPVGDTTYAAVAGSSMRPSLTEGDLAVLRRGAYGLGDVVAYRTSGPIVLHRIVAIDGEHVTLKGDANAWSDSARPTRAELLGKVWFSVPNAGILLGRGSITALLVLVPVALARQARAARRRRRADRPPPLALARAAPDAEGDRRGAIGTGSIAIFFALLATATFALPVNTTEHHSYTQHGSLTYAGSASPDAAYPDGRVATGDPVFLRIVDRLAVTFTYAIASDDTPTMEGALSMVATIGDRGSRWSRTIALRPPTRFLAPRQTTSATLDLAALRAMTQRFERITGQQPPHYDVSVVATVDLVGTLAQTPAKATLTATIPFTMNGQLLQPTEEPSGAPPAYAVARPGSVRASVGRPPTLIGVGYLPLRAAAGSGMLIFLALSLPYARRARRAVLRYPRRIARMIVEARADATRAPARSTVLVTSMEDLAWIAHRGNRPILHERREDADVFEVHDSDVVYRFETAKADATA